MRACLFSANSNKIKIIQVMGDNVVHGVNVTLTTNLVPIKQIDGGAKPRSSLGQSVVLRWLPFPNKDIMG